MIRNHAMDHRQTPTALIFVFTIMPSELGKEIGGTDMT